MLLDAMLMMLFDFLRCAFISSAKMFSLRCCFHCFLYFRCLLFSIFAYADDISFFLSLPFADADFRHFALIFFRHYALAYYVYDF